MSFEINQFKLGRCARLAMLIVFALISVPAMFASTLTPQCGQGSLADYLAEGSCTLGDYTLSGFTFSDSGTGDANLLSASQILVDPTGSTINNLSVQFSADGGFQVGEGQTAEYVFEFTVDPAFPSISGPSIDMGPNDPATLTGEFCGDGTIVSAPKTSPVVCQGTAGTGIFPATLLIAGNGNPSSVGSQFPSLVTTMDSRLILDLTGPAYVQSIGLGVGVTEGGPSSVPEPSTTLFLIPALGLLAWWRKKLPVRES